MQQQAEEEELGLSPLALAALTEFALENNLLGEEFGRYLVRQYDNGLPVQQQ